MKLFSLDILNDENNNTGARVFNLLLFIIIAAVCVVWAVEESLKVILDYDRKGYIVTLLAMPFCLFVSLGLKKPNLAKVLVFIYLCCYIGWLVVITFIEASMTGDVYTLASTLQWVPIILVVSFLFLPSRHAIVSAIGIYLSMLVLLVLARVDAFTAENAALNALLMHAVLSQGVCIFCMFGVVKLKRTKEASQIRAQKMEAAANIDGLLGIGNRRMLQQELNDRATNYTPFTLMLIDVDYFKAINDTHGHLVGDDVLREIAQCIESNLRPEDTLGRWGGEEFLLLSNGTNISNAKLLAERIRGTVEKSEFTQVGKVTISIGLAQFQPNTSVSQTFSLADKALYQAKDTGRNRVVVHEELT